ncbi:MAG: hypothetical protein CMM52_12245 [Rhodospirillaceae bacterium]|nr:hypothetical protein [Rhodospirillaceae bacterium]
MTEPKSTANATRAETLRGIGWTVIATGGLAGIVIAVRALKPDISVPELLFLRAVIGLVAISVIMIPKQGIRALITKRPGLQFVRNATHVGAQYCVFFGVIYVPLAVVTSVEYTIPAITAAIAAMTIGEKVKRYRWIGMAISFMGVLIVVRPGIVPVTLPIMVVILGTLLFSAQNVMVKVLSQTDSASTMVFTMNAIQCLILIGPAIYLWVTPQWHHVPWLLLLGFSGIITHFCLSKALVLIDTSVCFPIDFLRLPFIAVIAYLIWDETFSPWVAVGAFVIFVSTYFLVHKEAKDAEKSES